MTIILMLYSLFTPLYAATISLATFTPHFREMQTESGKKNTFERIILLEGQHFFSNETQWSYGPSLAMTVPSKGRDNLVTRQWSYLNFLVQYQWRFLYFQLGPGYFLSSLWAKGGEVSLSNGTGVDTFFIPQEYRNSINPSFHTKLGARWKDYSFRLQVITLSYKRPRSFSYSLELAYHFGAL